MTRNQGKPRTVGHTSATTADTLETSADCFTPIGIDRRSRSRGQSQDLRFAVVLVGDGQPLAAQARLLTERAGARGVPLSLVDGDKRGRVGVVVTASSRVAVLEEISG